MGYELAGKVALVTGSGHGIGRATALALAQRGVNIAINDIDAPAARTAAGDVRNLGVEALACVADVANPVDVHAMLDTVLARLGTVDILVNNAGIGGSGRLMIETPRQEWDRILSVDLTGVFLCCQAVIPHMVARGGGKIVNISSVFGLSGAAGSVAYSAAKAGVIGLTKSLARELATNHINVNAVAPGLIDTAMSRQRGTLETMRPDVPWPRIGYPKDVAELVVFLATPAADFITGQIISPNGGSHM
jgi:3-oxoacyl-[acyl-carrier protein] reductase